MQLTGFEWTVIGILGSIALTVIGFFVKGLVAKPEKHEDAINGIKLDFATKAEVKELDKRVRDIENNSVRKEDLRELKKELREETDKLDKSVTDLRENCLTRKEYTEGQNRLDDKLERALDILRGMRGGGGGA